jgi:hypothetical protein
MLLLIPLTTQSPPFSAYSQKSLPTLCPTVINKRVSWLVAVLLMKLAVQSIRVTLTAPHLPACHSTRLRSIVFAAKPTV